MSMEKRRDELGKLLACILVSRKGESTIRDLERDYRENEGRNIPYREFGFYSSLDFFRSISNHVELRPVSGTYMLKPVVSAKIQHVSDLVERQRPSRRRTPVRNSAGRSSRYYPLVREPKPFIQVTVQKEIAQILTSNPSGVNKTYIAQRLKESNAVSGTVNVNNVDEYLSSIPHVAVSRGNMVYPSRSLTAPTKTAHRRTPPKVDGFEMVTSRDSEAPQASVTNNNTQSEMCCPAGSEEGEEIYIDDEFDKENTAPPLPNVANNFATRDDHRAQQMSRNSDESRRKLSSAEFINQATFRCTDLQSRYDASLQENNNTEVNRNDVELEVANDRDPRENYMNADCTFESDDESSIDIIPTRIKSRLQQLIQKHPDGIWCADLLQVYLDEFKVSLNYTELGFASVCGLASNVPSILRLHRWNNRSDFLLYDATKPLPPAVRKPESPPSDGGWQYELDDDDVDPFPAALPLYTSQKLIPNDVLTHGESVGQERIPIIHDGPDPMFEVYVADVYNPSCFWIQLRKKLPKLNQLMKSMQEFYQTEGDNYIIPHVVLEKGLNCVCTFDNKWHRAMVKTVKPDGHVTLNFYDYGTTKTYPSDCVRFLVRKYSNLPAQAIACGLYNVKPINSNAWTRGVSVEFSNKVLDLVVYAIVVKVDRENNSMLVSLCDTQDESVDFHVNDWLVQQGFAEYGSMGDTVVFESPYFEDQISQSRNAGVTPANVPLVSPQSTLAESSKNTLRAPPGFTKPLQPLNSAAIMDQCLHPTSYNGTEIGNPTFLNCNVNLNNNLLASHDLTYDPLVSQTEAFVEFCKKRWEMQLAATVKKLLLINSNACTMNNAALNGLNTASPATSVNSTTEPSSKNPFKVYQETNEQELSAIINPLEEATDRLRNLSTNETDQSHIHNSTSLPNSDTLPNLTGINPELFKFDKPTEDGNSTFGTAKSYIATSKDYESSKKTLSNESQFETRQEDVSSNHANIANNDEALGLRLHDTNPFKQCIIRGFNSKGESCPPIPPRNPKFINKPENTTAKHVVDDKHTTLPVSSEQQNNHITKIYYKAAPVRYNINTRGDQASERNSEVYDDTPKLTDSVSFRDKDHYDIAKSPQDLTNHASCKNTSSSEGHTNSFFSGLGSQQNTSNVDNIFTPDRKFSTDHTQRLIPRTISNSYRPPPPPYNDNSSAEYQYKRKSISPRFTSPVASESSKAAIEAIQAALGLNFFDRLESVVTEAPDTTKRDKTLSNLGTCEKQTSSSSSSMTNKNTASAKTSESTPYYENMAKSKAPYKIKLIIPKFLQGQQSTVNSKQEPPDTLHRTKVPSETLDVRTTNAANASSSMPTLHSIQTSVNELHSFQRAHDNSSVTSKDDLTTDNSRLPFSNIEPRSSPPKNSSYPQPLPKNGSYPQAPPLNTTHFPPLYPNPGHLQHGPNYPYPMYQPETMQFLPANQRVPLFRPNIHGFPHPVPHWQRHRFFNPAFPYPGINNPPLLPNQYPWNTYNPYVPAPKQTAYDRCRTSTPNLSAASEINSHKESGQSQLNQTQKLGQKIEENNNTIQVIDVSKQSTNQFDTSSLTDTLTCDVPELLTNSHSIDTSDLKDRTLTTQLHGSSFPATDENVSANRTEKFVEKSSSQQLNGAQTLPVVPPRNYPVKSVNSIVNNVSQHVTPRPVKNVFKPIDVNEQKIYLFNIENQGWVCTEEIISTFTPYNNLNMVLRLLETKDVKIKFKVVSRAQSPLLFDELDSTTIRLPRMTNSGRIKGTLHLTPLDSLIHVMFYLKIISQEEIVQRQRLPGSKLPELVKLIKAYQSDDEYWFA